MAFIFSLPQSQSPPVWGRKVCKPFGQFIFPNHGLWLVYQGFASNPSHS